MDSSIYIDAVRKANCALELDRRIVGVRFLFNEEEFNDAEAERPTGKMTYCSMVTRATKGQGIKADFDNFGCFAAARVLGIVDLDDWYASGHYYGKCGLYQDYPTAREVTSNISKIDHKAYGVEVRPLEDFNIAPHVVIVASNTYNIMRFIQGYTYKFGTHSSYKFIGNQALCAECTAHPYQTNDINVSFLCAGTRKSGLNDNEAAIGIPLTKFIDMVDGLCKTITPVENNPRKQVIEKRFKDSNLTDVEIIFNKNYGDGMHQHDFAYFKKR